MQGQVSGLSRAGHAAARARARARSASPRSRGGRHRKGRTFEERVDAAIDRIAGIRGDVRSPHRASGAEAGGKKGDTVVEIGAAAAPLAAHRLRGEESPEALEERCLDRAQRLHGRARCRRLRRPCRRRRGQDSLRAPRLTEYQGNKMIAAVDREEPDALALRSPTATRAPASRWRATTARGRRRAVRDAAEEALLDLKAAQAIRRNLDRDQDQLRSRSRRTRGDDGRRSRSSWPDRVTGRRGDRGAGSRSRVGRLGAVRGARAAAARSGRSCARARPDAGRL